jgi:hypothetical protein
MGWLNRFSEAQKGRMHLFRREISAFDYHVQSGQLFRALLISDLHIAYSSSHSESTRGLLEKVRWVIDTEHPTAVFARLGVPSGGEHLNTVPRKTRFFDNLSFDSIGVIPIGGGAFPQLIHQLEKDRL